MLRESQSGKSQWMAGESSAHSRYWKRESPIPQTQPRKVARLTRVGCGWDTNPDYVPDEVFDVIRIMIL